MRFKLDENFGSRSANLLFEAGHDVETVHQEGLSGATDEVLLRKCVSERRCLLTFDLDFADVLRFPPHKGAGIAVLRVPKGASTRLIDRFVRTLLLLLESEAIAGRLWVVEAGRIRIHQDTDPERTY